MGKVSEGISITKRPLKSFLEIKREEGNKQAATFESFSALSFVPMVPLATFEAIPDVRDGAGGDANAGEMEPLNVAIRALTGYHLTEGNATAIAVCFVPSFTG